ncbi:Mu transposase C-terminal domain-containing protein [Paenibacillus sp. MMS18-CY102]|uniref:Mu transposase C-terminal domain-containing protein n=1 Tax=Paenibacillus sp. MMS18-CY102 TaxID=2682849 RepID=UPI001365B76F|nr:Mu transposase C-terminal domain-containing protein [Paenibacillus sp. MMS18-CY102]MWC27179.1 DDE-type integrase/transposase/recombinase [Paenibacillus sp. MMS18-CY102]
MLTVNAVLEWIDDQLQVRSLERVLWIDPCNDRLIVIDLDKTGALPVEREMSQVNKAVTDGLVIKRSVDPYAKLISESQIKEKDKQTRDRWWSLIESIVSDVPDIYDPRLRGAMVAQIVDKSGVSKKYVYRSLSRYWQGGNKNALLPRYYNCGNPGQEKKVTETSLKRGRKSRLGKFDPEKQGVNIDEDMKQLFRVGVRLYYNTKERYPLRHCFKMIQENHMNLGYASVHGVNVPILPPSHELPTFGEFKYWYEKEFDLKATLQAREGVRRCHLQHRAVLGTSTEMSFGPGSIYQIDATIADVYLVNSMDRTQIIGRPIIYHVKDAFSRRIVGLYVGLEGPSWNGAKMALANTFTEKVSYCAEFGIHINEEDWDSAYLPQALLGDRGELIGFNSDNVVESLEMRISNTPPYRCDWKGIVEQSFRIANLKSIKWVPGAVKERALERGERDYRLDATLDLHQFTRLMIYTVLNHNNSHWMEWYNRNEFMIQDHVNPVPDQLWNWGIQNRSGHLREKPSEIIKLALMERDYATVTPFGIRYKNRHYSCQKAIDEQWFERARNRGSWKVEFAFDSRNVADTINLISKDGMSYEVCTLLERDHKYLGKRHEEVLDIEEQEKLDLQLYQSNAAQSDAELRAIRESIVNEAKQQTEEANENVSLSNAQRTKGIRTNRTVSKEAERRREAWNLGDMKPPEELSIVQKVQEGYKPSKQSSYLDMLKKQNPGGS